METLSLGERFIREDWCVAKLIGHKKILFAKGKDRTLYNCTDDKIEKAFKVKEDWDPKRKPETVQV